jgi:transcriptional regulator with XRE-family HTH domain
MSAPNNLTKAPPFQVETTLRKLGRNLRLARIRRKQTLAQAAERIGTGVRAVRDAESGKASTGIAVYAGLLWLYDLLGPLEDLADPQTDKEGLALAAGNEGQRARRSGGLDNDF